MKAVERARDCAARARSRTADCRRTHRPLERPANSPALRSHPARRPRGQRGKHAGADDLTARAAPGRRIARDSSRQWRKQPAPAIKPPDTSVIGKARELPGTTLVPGPPPAREAWQAWGCNRSDWPRRSVRRIAAGHICHWKGPRILRYCNTSRPIRRHGTASPRARADLTQALSVGLLLPAEQPADAAHDAPGQLPGHLAAGGGDGGVLHPAQH